MYRPDPMPPKAPETVKTTVRIPLELWRRAKIKCVVERREFQEVMITALRAYLGRSSPTRK